MSDDGWLWRKNYFFFFFLDRVGHRDFRVDLMRKTETLDSIYGMYRYHDNNNVKTYSGLMSSSEINEKVCNICGEYGIEFIV